MITERIGIQEFYKGKKIFITGGTGFLGIALVEKLLRSCDVDTVYLLIRPKNGKGIEDRLKKLKMNSVFGRLRNRPGNNPLDKLVAIAGDVGEENLGLSSSDREILINNVNVVFHSAATLDFEAGLKSSVSINLLGTRRIVQLCSKMKEIPILVHVSSVYANTSSYYVDEHLYAPPAVVQDVIHLVNTLPEAALDELTPRLLKDHPNAYTFTKALAEHEVHEGAKACAATRWSIVRPSMIVGAWLQPECGWTISKNGPQGFIMGAAKGVIRRLPVKKDLVYDYIPVDIVVNTLIVAGAKAFGNGFNGAEVYHCSSSTTRPFTWAQVEDKINERLISLPLKSAVWYPTMKFLPSLTVFRISAIFFHFIPAFIFDSLTRLQGGRPKLMRLHRNVNRSLNRLAPFIFQEWKFRNKNTMALQETLTEADKVEFNMDVTSLDWVEFFTSLVGGVREYLHMEDFDTLPAARRKIKILFVLNILVQIIFFAGIWYFAAVISGSTMASVFWIVPLTYSLYNTI